MCDVMCNGCGRVFDILRECVGQGVSVALCGCVGLCMG